MVMVSRCSELLCCVLRATLWAQCRVYVLCDAFAVYKRIANGCFVCSVCAILI